MERMEEELGMTDEEEIEMYEELEKKFEEGG